MARRYSHRPLFPNPVVSFFLFWLGYILNGSTLPPSVTFCTARYAGVTSFDGYGRLAAHSGRIIQILRGVQILGTIVGDDDVVETESKRHLLRESILLGVSSDQPISVWAKALVEVAAVEVDKVIAAINDLLGDEIRGALGLRAVFFPGIKAIHAFVVDGIDVRNLLFEGRDVDKREKDNRSGHLRGIEGGDEVLKRDDGGVFGAVRAGHQGEESAGLHAAHDHHRNLRARVHARRNIDEAGGFLAAVGYGGAHGEG